MSTQANFYSTPDQFLQEPDSRPGPYFVTALDAGRMHVMAGPYDSHADALADVDRAQAIAYSHDARAWFMAWGPAPAGSACGPTT